MNNIFATYHPVINFLYFTLVILTTMFIMHPIMLAISLLLACTTCICMNGKKGLKFVLMMLPMLIIVAIINPLFNHEGVTTLLFINDNPITLEACFYGCVSAMMFVSVIIWFSCYNTVMTSDKFIFLFGRIIPSLSLIFSMVLRLVPRFKAQLKNITNGQKCIGKGLSQNKLTANIKNSSHVISILLSWGLENSIDTADSMKSRGYGLPGRTAFSNFRFDKRDLFALVFLLVTFSSVLLGILNGQASAKYFPLIVLSTINFHGVITYLGYALLLMFPLIVNVTEEIKWTVLKSRI
ncbi:MAG: energy-coupling factor transporter transmembrane component T [Oscillospiraceae bacterium]